MATQTISVSAFQTLCAEVSDAIAAEDFATAWSKYAQAESVNAALELEVGSEGVSVRRRNNLEGIRKALESTQARVERSGQKGKRTINFKTRRGN